jgi:hypothetical protein
MCVNLPAKDDTDSNVQVSDTRNDEKSFKSWPNTVFQIVQAIKNIS